MQRAFEHTLSILVVEDDKAVAELIRTVLNDVVGWGATVVHDASAARQVFQHVRIDVIVLDVNLPGISGLELLALLRQAPLWNDPPIILMSARAGQPGIGEALRDGLVTTFLPKPFDIDQLVQEINERGRTGSGSLAVHHAGGNSPGPTPSMKRRGRA